MIILGPGSLYTSVLPNLIVRGVPEAIRESHAPRVYVCNVMTQPGETDDFTASDHVKAILSHAGHGIMDYVIVNTGDIPGELLGKYRQEGAVPVIPDIERVEALGIKVIQGDFISKTDVVRHDPRKLASAIVGML